MLYLLILLHCSLCLSALVQADFPIDLNGPNHHTHSQPENRGASQVLNLVRGLLLSEKIISLLPDIPCDIIDILENDADQASTFIDQLQKGQVPTLIENLPQEALDTFTNVFGIFKTLPSQLLDTAHAAVTGAAHIFNDIETGAIVSDLAAVPDIVISDITSEWGDLTSGLKSDWDALTHGIACLVVDCPVSTRVSGLCQRNTAVTATTTTSTTGPGLPTSIASIPTAVVVTVTPFTATPVHIPTSLPSTTTVTSPTHTTVTGNLSRAANPTVSSIFTGGSARILPASHMLEGIMNDCVMAALGLFIVAVWL